MNKTILIVWKWDDLVDDGLRTDLFCPVYNKPDYNIIRVNEKRTEASVKGLGEIIAGLNATGKVQVFLHRDHGYSVEDITSLKELVLDLDHKVKYFLFGGGDDFIYYACSEMGLLDDFGNFMDEPEFGFRKLDSKGNTISGVKVVSVTKFNNITKRTEVLPYYFEKVWKYYEYEFVKKIYHLKQEFFHTVYPACVLNGAKPFLLGDVLKQTDSNLYNALAYFCNEISAQTNGSARVIKDFELDQLCQQDSAKKQVYQQLKEMLHRKTFGKSPEPTEIKDLHQLRDGFDALLDSIEKIS